MSYWAFPSDYIPIEKKETTEEKELLLILKVCEVNGITFEQFKSKARTRQNSETRFILGYLFYKKLGYSLTQSGKLIGKNHSTAHYGVNEVIKFMDWEEDFKDKVNRLTAFAIRTFEIKVPKDKVSFKKSKHKGVSWHKGNKKYRATFSSNGIQKDLGYFKSEEDARIAYEQYKSELTKIN